MRKFDRNSDLISLNAIGDEKRIISVWALISSARHTDWPDFALVLSLFASATVTTAHGTFPSFSSFSLIKLVISLLLWMSVWITSRRWSFLWLTNEWSDFLKLFNFFFKCFLSTYISLVECVVGAQLVVGILWLLFSPVPAGDGSSTLFYDRSSHHANLTTPWDTHTQLETQTDSKY